MLATLGRSGSSYTTGNWQTYDVWGSVRSGSSSEQQGYVANLGHRSDPESFLTYMRARYYEPMTGRFISEDPKRDGSNWFIYAANAPTSFADFSGTNPFLIAFLLGFIVAALADAVFQFGTKGEVDWLEVLAVGAGGGVLAAGGVLIAGILAATSAATGVSVAAITLGAVSAKTVAIALATTILGGVVSGAVAAVLYNYASQIMAKGLLETIHDDEILSDPYGIEGMGGW
jgi:RHS repeat-associated protein